MNTELSAQSSFKASGTGTMEVSGAQTKINRKEFGLSFNAVLDGRLVVSEEIQIQIEGEIVEQKEAAETAGG